MARGGLWGGSEVALGVGGDGTGVALGAQWWHWGSVGSRGWQRGGTGGTEVALGICAVALGVCGVLGWHKGGTGGPWGGTEVAMRVCGVRGWHRGGIRGTGVALGVSGVTQGWH